jgi:hypothetical protein
MPSFWPDGVAVNKEMLAGDSEKQIAAIWAYLTQKNFTDLPAGLVQGRQEIVATNEAVIYRNFIDGGGSRAIGVGYPEKANICFDANEMRLAMFWQGPFIDAARHRTGRGDGYEKPLGTNVVKGPPGSPLARLQSESAPWPSATGKAAGYQFRGYSLDEKQRPAFRYTFEGLDVEDYPIAIPGEVDADLKRTIKIKSANPADNLYFALPSGRRLTRRKAHLSSTIGSESRLPAPNRARAPSTGNRNCWYLSRSKTARRPSPRQSHGNAQSNPNTSTPPDRGGFCRVERRHRREGSGVLPND